MSGKFKEIGGATLNYGIGKFLPQVIGFFLIPIYTTYLTPEDYGIVELATAVGAFSIIFMRLALPGSVSRFYYEHKEGPELRDYITTIYWSLLAISVGMAALIYVLAYFFLHSLVPGLPLWPFVGVVLLTDIFSTNSEIQKRLVQARKQSAYSAKLSIATSLIGILTAIILVVGFKMGGLGIVCASLAGSIIFFIQAQFYLRKDMGGNFSFKLLIPSFKYSMNMLPAHLASPFTNLFSRALLAGHMLSAVGFYSLAMRFFTPLSMLSSAFNEAYIPLYFEARKKNDADSRVKLNGALKNIWIVSQILFVGAALFSPALIEIMTPEKYHSAALLVPFMAINFPFGIMTSFVSVEIFYSKKTYWVSIYAFFKFVINISVIYFTMPYLNEYALVLALIVDGVYSSTFYAIVSRRIYNSGLHFRLLYLIFAISLVFFAAGTWINFTVVNTVVKLACCTAIFGVYIFLLWFKGWFTPKSILNTFKKNKK